LLFLVRKTIVLRSEEGTSMAFAVGEPGRKGQYE